MPQSSNESYDWALSTVGEVFRGGWSEQVFQEALSEQYAFQNPVDAIPN